MTNPTVFLGWCRLLETNAEGLAALHGLCGALEVRTHWSPDRRTLYLESPVQGQAVWLESGNSPPPAGLSAALARAAHALEAAGARVIIPEGDPAGRGSQRRAAGPDVLVHLAGGGDDALEAVFSTTVPGRSRVLARTLLAAAAAATGLPERGVRFRWPRTPPAAALAGVDCPAAALMVPESGGAQAGALGHAIWDAVMRFLAPPDLAELLDRLALRRAPALAELPPVAGGEDIYAAPPLAVCERPTRPVPPPARAAAPQSAAAPPAPPRPAPVRPTEAAPVTTPPAGGNPLCPPGARHVYVFRILSGGRAAFSLQSAPAATPYPMSMAGPTSSPSPEPDASPAPGPSPAPAPGPGAPSPLVSARGLPPVVPFRPTPAGAAPPGGRFPSRLGRAVPLLGPVRRRRGHWQASGPPK